MYVYARQCQYESMSQLKRSQPLLFVFVGAYECVCLVLPTTQRGTFMAVQSRASFFVGLGSTQCILAFDELSSSGFLHGPVTPCFSLGAKNPAEGQPPLLSSAQRERVITSSAT